MNMWTYHEVLTAARGSWAVEPDADAFDFAGAAIDSRELARGQVFFAFVGEHTDGHAYLQQAADRGAGLCVVTDAERVPAGFTTPTLVVDNALDALTEFARAWREKLACTVIAVTGSNGKTTTCGLLHSVCAQAGKTAVSQKSFNNALGVPITVLNTPRDAEYLIAELGTSTPGEIAARAALIRPDIAVITSIGRAHLESLGSVAGVAREKAALVAALPAEGRVFIPAGIAELDTALAEMGRAVGAIRLGEETGFGIHRSTPEGMVFVVDDAEFTVPLPGVHNARNAAMAVLVARSLGISDGQIQSGLASARGPAMRFERIEVPTESAPIVIINDAYNANPDSMRAALATFDELDIDGPRIAVLGEMLELGGASVVEHAALAQSLDEHRRIDCFVLVGERYGPVPISNLVQVHPDAASVSIERIAATIEPGSCVLLKGSRGVRLERVIEELARIHGAGRPGPAATSTAHA
ncbi:MAG: UDP-N-acetylmuramoyl-tripeptide--D-alanyl-D-alanine ligase [Phycisphaerales bacterium]